MSHPWERDADRRDREADAYVDWCEQRDLDPDDDHWDEFQQDQEDRADAAAEQRQELLDDMRREEGR